MMGCVPEGEEIRKSKPVDSVSVVCNAECAECSRSGTEDAQLCRSKTEDAE